MIRRIAILSALLITAVVSCTSEPREGPDGGGNANTGDQAEIVLRLHAPGGFTSPRSRAMTQESENRIDNIYVLAFDQSNTLMAIAEGRSVGGSASGDQVSFSVALPVGTGSGRERLVVLANAADIVENELGTDAALAPARDYDAIARLLIDHIAGAMYVSGGVIPMWGETPPIEVRAGSISENVELVRAIARVDVGLGDPTHDPATGTYTWTGFDSSGKKIPFEIRHVYIIRPHDSFAVMPASANLGVDGSVEKPTIPAGSGVFSVDDSKQKFAFTVNGGLSTQRSIYVPEAEIVMGGQSGDGFHTARMAVIVGGSYNGNPESFYRVDFADINNDLVDVLRNHLYQFNIAAVLADGLPSVEEAYSSQAMNMKVNVMDWDEEQINDIEFDGTSYFALDRREVTFEPMGGQSVEVAIRTNVGNFEMWCDGAKRFDASSPPNGAIYDGYQYTLVPRSGKNDEYLLTIYCPQSNVSPTDDPGQRFSQWTFVAGRMQVHFDVDQQWMRNYISVADGEASTLMPEGTAGEAIPIEIMSTQPVTVRSSESWVAGVNDAVLQNGVYAAKLGLTVAPFRFGPDGNTDRTATIIITPQGEAPIRYTITQQAPYLRMAQNEIYVPHPTSTATPVLTTVDVMTNILASDLNLERVGGDAMITLSGGLEAYDPREPRYRRFRVATDFTAVATGNYSASFKVTPATKYGQVPPTNVNIRVNNSADRFDIYWRSAEFGAGASPWTPSRYTDSGDYLFPWNTSVVEFDVVTNASAIEDQTASSLGSANLAAGTPTTDAGYQRYPFALTLNNDTPDAEHIYDVVFRPQSSSGIQHRFDVHVGSQSLSNTPLPNSGKVGPEGYPQSSPATISITSNVRWRASSSANWVTLRLGNTGAFRYESIGKHNHARCEHSSIYDSERP